MVLAIRSGKPRLQVRLGHNTQVANDWFRSPDWDNAARADFEDRLARARPIQPAAIPANQGPQLAPLAMG